MSAQCTKTAWLSSKLKQFALDEEIYLNYIESVLDGEEDRCEKISALEAILGEVLSENEVKTQCMEIIDMYDTQDDSGASEIKIPIEDTEEALVKMLENNIRTVVTVPNKTNKLNSDEEDSDLVKIRKNILSQYAQKEANSEEEESDDLDIEHNTNASSVLALKKEQRERAKEQSLRKKEKDKEDREKQKQLAQEKKDAKKKKAQKVERKR
ncbi:coiled-coil domain-containing protein 43 [Rhopalosiphum padi]|uniref:coiled-coil domain-containing protein 43 n=1 Tax=Rhopalosiphum padi TaxID=40932 RepID=UPI00298D87B9|nr:coiled-coil domain-containing protein 43 [Rhopalosiphum padi]